MSLIKSLIQRLLDSRTTPEEAGHSAMPSPNEVSLTPSVTTKEVWGDVCTGTASSDGYIRMSFSATSPEAIGSARSFGAVVFSTPQLKGDIVSVVCPVAKGKAYAMSARNANNITCAFVKLMGAIGGGYNHFVRRALPCLRPSFNYLPRSFCKAKNNGSAAKPFLIQELNSVTQQEGMLLQRTDTSVSSMQAAQEAVCFLTSTQERIQMCHRQIVVSETVGCLLRTLTWGLLSLLKKECQSILRRIQSQNRFGSVQRQGGVNFRTGGALC